MGIPMVNFLSAQHATPSESVRNYKNGHNHD